MGQDLNIEVRLVLTGVSQQVQVVATAPAVDATKTDVSQVIGTQQIQDYPLNGRRADQFALRTPGVTNDSNYGLLSFRGIANGNTFLLDGLDATEQFYVENNGRTRITSQISLDSVQEFQVVSTDYSAEYGRANGGIVNTVTRSGTNNLHGTAFGFFRNQDLMARDPYTPISFPIPAQWRLQSGGSIGGPIIKDKLFFYVGTEFMRNNWPLEDVVQLHKDFSHGIMADLSYTLSHELDDGQGYGQGTSNMYLSNNFSWLDNGVFKLDYGNGEEDQPQRFVLSWVWNLPETHHTGAFFTYVVNNWQLASITTLDGARPYGSADVTLNDDPITTANGDSGTMFSDFSLNGTGLSGRVPWWPIDSVNEPAIYREDLRITKSFPFKERYRVDVGLEIFNVFNSWAPTVPQTGNAYQEAFNSTLKEPIITPAEFQVTNLNPPANYGVFGGCQCSDTWPVDGTEARRLQVMGRFTF